MAHHRSGPRIVRLLKSQGLIRIIPQPQHHQLAVTRAEKFNFLAERMGAWLSDGIEPHAIGVAARSAALAREAREALRVAVIGAEVTLWNLTRPDRATRIATLAGPRDYFAALAFSPRGNLLAGVTYHGSLLVFRVAGPAGPVLVTTRPGILASARFPGGGRGPAIPCGCGVDAAYAAAFTADGHALTVVIARPETSPSTAARDTVFTWQVTGPGALSGLTTIVRDVSDAQPILAAGGRIVADGAAVGGGVHLWGLP